MPASDSIVANLIETFGSFLQQVADSVRAEHRLRHGYAGNTSTGISEPTMDYLKQAGYIDGDSPRSSLDKPLDTPLDDSFADASAIARSICQINSIGMGSIQQPPEDQVPKCIPQEISNFSDFSGSSFIEDVSMAEHIASAKIKHSVEGELLERLRDTIDVNIVKDQIRVAAESAKNKLFEDGVSAVDNPSEYKVKLLNLINDYTADYLEEAINQSARRRAEEQVAVEERDSEAVVEERDSEAVVEERDSEAVVEEREDNDCADPCC
jgi:hypothetical protein